MTRQVALLGKPLKRRHSQVMHDAAFDACGIDARYVLCEIEPDDVAGVVASARGEDWLGLGVTAPYKPVVAGLVDEVRRLAAPDQGGTGPGLGTTAARAVGYAEILAWLRGESTEERARTAIVANTRRLARKQMGWFGRDPRVHWLDAASPTLLDEARALVAAADSGTIPAPGQGPVRRTLGA